ncbi:hypothetical protein GIB67_014703 [Kingdonia uniflora]|uniref:Uncharacterized protein n=1 Tax=Kingdonia uniflora TaxID=39325 RepID=A0A7J7NUN4_9MAGN|nr:hypothetical protein GIB67_014703 [Kingdonia uniflora]
MNFLQNFENTSRPASTLPGNKSCLVGGSECGTEISVSSVLDSPNKNEVYGGKLEHESELLGELTYGRNGTFDNASNSKNIDTEVVAIDSSEVKQHPDGSESDVPNQLEKITDPITWKLSPNRSPESHITASEAYGTPSSEVSGKAKRNKVDKSGPTKKIKSHSADPTWEDFETRYASQATRKLHQLQVIFRARRLLGFGLRRSCENTVATSINTSAGYGKFRGRIRGSKLKAHEIVDFDMQDEFGDFEGVTKVARASSGARPV